MITRKSLGPHICLRCQRSLAKRSFHLHSTQTLSERRRYSHQAVRKVDDEDAETDNADVSNLGEKYDTRIAQGKLRGHRGIFQREDLEELRGATALGDQAKVIVLRDSIFRKYVLDTQEIKTVRPKHIDILGTLAEERGLVGEDEVMQNIDAFRPREADGIQDWDELNKLTHALEQGFTTTQLEKYIKNFKNKREIEKPPEIWKANDNTSAITRITPWLPGISAVEDHFDNDPLREYYLQSHTPKQVLALRLLRECWMLELPELVDGIGQFEIRLRNGDLDLLLLGPNSVLNTIHTTHLHFDEERLEAYRSRNTIRVTTTNAKKYVIVDAIQQAVKCIRRDDINISAILPKNLSARQIDKFVETHFDDAALAALGQLTNTKITRPARTHFQVACIESDPDAPSSRIDVVRRLVLTCDSSASRIEHDLAIKQKGSASGAMIGYTLTQGLNWRQKLRSWMRFTAPISKELPVIEEPIIQPDLATLPSTQTSPTEPPMPVTESSEAGEATDGPVHWSSRYFTDTSALMGTVLFSNPQNSIEPSLTTLNTPGLLQAFSTRVPNLSRVLSRADLMNKKPTERLIVRFQPDPFVLVPKQQIRRKKYPISSKGIPIGIETLSPFPNLEMTFNIDGKTKDSKLQNVIAIVHEKKIDVMQPKSAVDVRFQQRTTSRLSRRYLKPIRTFLAKSQLNLGGLGKLDLPPSIILPISNHLCRGQGFEVLGDKEADKSAGDREVQYLFAGLEIHRTLVFDWRGFHVSYTSIEAGKAGGRRAELKIRPIRQNKVVKEKDFVQAAYRLADMLGDGSGEHVDFDEVKTVSTMQRQGGLMRPVHTKPKLLFDYFSGKFKINKGVGGESASWEESEEIKDEDEDDVDDEEEEMDIDEFNDVNQFEEELQGELPWQHERGDER